MSNQTHERCESAADAAADKKRYRPNENGNFGGTLLKTDYIMRCIQLTVMRIVCVCVSTTHCAIHQKESIEIAFAVSSI